MARQQVSTIMSNISATVNQDPTAPATGGPDYNLWLQFINRAQLEWSEAYDWEELKKIYTPTVTGTATATVTLPLDFRKLGGPVKYNDPGFSNGVDYPEILPEEIDNYNTSDKFFYIQGDFNNGHYLIWNPGTLPSGASVAIGYYAMPASLLNPTDFSTMADTEFLVDRTIAYVLEARSDPRYQDQEQKARERLLNMIENSSLAKYNSYSNPAFVKTVERRTHFRFGRN